MKGRAKPLYEQIKDSIRAQIIRGDLRSEELAPSEAEIIAQYGVSSITARRCLNDLESEGYVQRIKGRGTYVRALDALELQRHVGIFYHELVSLSGYFVSSTFSGILQELKQSRLEPDLLSWAPIRRSSTPSEALVDLTRLRRVDASILVSPVPEAWLRDIVQIGQPVVSLGFSYNHSQICSVLPDFSEIAQHRTERLKALGHKRIAVFHEHFDEPAEGVVFQKLDWDSHIFDISRVEIPFMRYDELENAISRLTRSPEAPTLYYVYGYELALYVRQYLNDRGLDVPNDVSIIVAGNCPGPTRFELEEVPTVKMGQMAVRLLLEGLHAGVPVRKNHSFPVVVREGTTLKRASTARRVSRRKQS